MNGLHVFDTLDRLFEALLGALDNLSESGVGLWGGRGLFFRAVWRKYMSEPRRVHVKKPTKTHGQAGHHQRNGHQGNAQREA